MNPLRRCLLPVLLLALAGCATLSGPSGGRLVCEGEAAAAGASASPCAQHIASAMQAEEAAPWSLQGRAAISHEGRGGSVHVDWQDRVAVGYAVTLSAPVTRQSWRLEVDGGQARLEGMRDGPRTGTDAAVLLQEATGWDIPVEQMRHWLRGRAAPSPRPQRWEFAAVGGELLALEQAGWRVQFERADDGLPNRLEAERSRSKVRLVVDQWGRPDGE